MVEVTEAGGRRSRWWSPSFVVCAVIVLLAGFGMSPAMTALAARFQKSPAPIRRPLTELNLDALEAFRAAPAESPFQEWAVADEMAGTHEWVKLRLQDRTSRGADGQVQLFVTFYNAPDDLVPHTPEVCYRQGRAIVRDVRKLAIDSRGTDGEQRAIAVKSVLIEQGPHRITVVYAFCVNGAFTTDRLGVRLAMQLPGRRRVYFSKIEAVSPVDQGESRADAERRCQMLLSEAIPILQAQHFPAD